MKITFIILFVLALAAFGFMRYHQYQFEKSSQLKFNVMDFELPGSKENLNKLILEWSSPESKEFVLDQLRIDYLFMSTLFPTILMLCLLVRRRLQESFFKSKTIPKYQILNYLLLGLAFLQLFAWIFDIMENIRLSTWIKLGEVGNMFLFETLVKLKFLFAILGFLGPIAICIWLKSTRKVKLR
ncbi:hypothetical protein [Aquiflexum sp.]|uniref:hypothetical protein n=1 Tax=Aquiflexum sp. TaxID=1872584 RepID=UPI0035936A89